MISKLKYLALFTSALAFGCTGIGSTTGQVSCYQTASGVVCVQSSEIDTEDQDVDGDGEKDSFLCADEDADGDDIPAAEDEDECVHPEEDGVSKEEQALESECFEECKETDYGFRCVTECNDGSRCVLECVVDGEEKTCEEACTEGEGAPEGDKEGEGAEGDKDGDGISDDMDCGEHMGGDKEEGVEGSDGDKEEGATEGDKEEPSAEEPKDEEPSAEEPPKEEPPAEEPPKEEPPVEEPKDGEGI